MSTPPTTSPLPLVQQLLPMIALQGGGNGGGNKGNLKNLIIFDAVTKFLPLAGGVISNIIRRKIKQRGDSFYTMMRDSSGNIKKGSVLIERTGDDDMFDAILSLASDLPQTKYIKRANGAFTVETLEEIPLGDTVMFRRLAPQADSASDTPKMVIEVFSYEKNIVQLRDYLNDIQTKYTTLRDNALGRKIYYFDEIVQPPVMTIQGGPDLSKSSRSLLFSMYPLMTNKSMTNVFGAAVRKARKRVDFFVNNRTWYESKGVPYTMGILLHGKPGCGKSSFCKAISKDTHRHIINVKLSEYTTVTQLNNLFYSGRVNVLKDGIHVSYNIPIDKVIIVIEDIDCLSSIVLDRKGRAAAKVQQDVPSVLDAANISVLIDGITSIGLPKTLEDQQKLLEKMDQLKQLKDLHTEKRMIKTLHKDLEAKSGLSEKLNLSHLLNVLDGILETPGRILIMTSNHPERLDPALVRPGRIDSIINFTYCSKDDIFEMIENICDTEVHNKNMYDIPEYVWSPARVTQVIFENIESVETILEVLKQPPPLEEFGEEDGEGEDELATQMIQAVIPVHPPTDTEVTKVPPKVQTIQTAPKAQDPSGVECGTGDFLIVDAMNVAWGERVRETPVLPGEPCLEVKVHQEIAEKINNLPCNEAHKALVKASKE